MQQAGVGCPTLKSIRLMPQSDTWDDAFRTSGRDDHRRVLLLFAEGFHTSERNLQSVSPIKRGGFVFLGDPTDDSRRFVIAICDPDALRDQYALLRFPRR